MSEQPRAGNGMAGAVGSCGPDQRGFGSAPAAPKGVGKGGKSGYQSSGSLEIAEASSHPSGYQSSGSSSRAVKSGKCGRRSQENWADITSDSEGELSSRWESSGSSREDPSTNGSVRSQPSHGDSPDHGGPGPKMKAKLRNKGLTKEELAHSTPPKSGSGSLRSEGSFHSFQSAGDLNASAINILQQGNDPLRSCNLDASHAGDLNDDSSSNSEVSLTEASTMSGRAMALPPGQIGVLPSIGSALHQEGACKPCRFAQTDSGCQRGATCEFCHYPHKRKSKPGRPCKGKRDRCRRFMDRTGDLDPAFAMVQSLLDEADADDSAEATPPEATREPRNHSIEADQFLEPRNHSIEAT